MHYQEVQTKREFEVLLQELISQTNDMIEKYPELSIYQSISNQLKDISLNIKNKVFLSNDKIYERYSLGAIAVKNFECNKELYGRKLQDIFGGLFEYSEMPET